MSPILKEIKEVFDSYKKYLTSDLDSVPICGKNPFRCENEWMHTYLFPEVLQLTTKLNLRLTYFACCFCSEEQVLRIMAEHGLL